MPAGAHHLLALAEVHLGRRGENHRVGTLDPLAQLAGMVRDAIFFRHLRRRILIPPDKRGDFDFRNALEGIEVLLAEGALAGNADFHPWLLRTARLAVCAARRLFSRMMWPTAVFEAGTV